MTDLSPAAQAVLDAACREMNYTPRRYVQWVTAGALKAAADQVVPKIKKPARDGHDLDLWHWMVGCWCADQDTRAKLLAIAAELEGNND